MNSIVVIQARLSSTRLPAKALLPISGMPMVVLAAKRAANTGRDVIVVTSEDDSDNSLCRTLEEYNISYFRGSLNNTLQRFVSALHHFPDRTLVIRLTADNIFPDGKFLDELEEYFYKKSLSYLHTTDVTSGLPYGMSAEMMRLSDLREALSQTSSAFDQEHVTPYIISKHGKVFLKTYADIGMGHLRCTVDNFDDYLAIQDVFNGISNPVMVTWKKLVKRLQGGQLQPQVKTPPTGMTLGTAQLGMQYGITNTSSINDDEKIDLIRLAIINGVNSIDTAQAYGLSEQIIGEALKNGWNSRVKIITKLSPLSSLSGNSSTNCVRFAVESSILNSCRNLNCSVLDTVLLHRMDHLTSWDGAAWVRLLEFVGEGVIKKLGASIQTLEEFETAIACEDITLIQLPYNILDNRWDSAIEKLMKAKENRIISIHARSSLLQGLLTTQNLDLWNLALINNGQQIIDWLSDISNKLDRESIVDLCLSYVKSQPWIDAVVLGADNSEQLIENIQLIANKPLTSQEITMISTTRPDFESSALNPTLWRSK